MLTHSPPVRLRSGRRSRVARRVAAVAVIVGGLVGALLAPFAATAAPPYTTSATVSSLAFTEQAVASGTKAELTGTWSLPDNPVAPAGFVVELPEGLRGLPDTFPLLDADGQEAGRCVTTATQLVCDIDTAYVQGHPIGLSGGFSFWATVTTEVTETTTVTYDFGDVTASVDVKPDPFLCTTDCDFRGRTDFKSGEYQNGSDTIAWDVAVGAGAKGMAAGQEVVVTDVIGPDQELLRESASGERYPSLWVATGLQTLASGLVVPGPITEVPAADYTVSADGTTVAFTAREGAFYNVHYLSRVTDDGVAGTYRNAAEIRVGTETSSTVTSTVTRHGGSGTGNGTRVGSFSARKTLIGPEAATGRVPVTTRYVLEYAYPAGTGFPAGSGVLTLEAGSPVSSPKLPVGAEVTVRERAPEPVAGTTWGTPVISPERFTVSDETVVVSVQNPVSVVPPPVPSTPPTPGVPSTPPTPGTPVTPSTPGTPGHSLASTGGEIATAGALAGVLLLGMGGVLAAARRARRENR
ncbi:DUF5979 domain-containing protein [Microbacterium sp.]|uniref:DUF5979 domain-containing protein n=1 Tax=Microbacterium sp. TaxID=51671 RepID=UPI0028A247A0|nr:DUF5979 domain-containing protein [Microbacterium sp.]